MLSDQSVAVGIALCDIFQDGSIARGLHCLLVSLTFDSISQSLLHSSNFEVERQRRDQLFGDGKEESLSSSVSCSPVIKNGRGSQTRFAAPIPSNEAITSATFDTKMRAT
jgi:hypothetical protein